MSLHGTVVRVGNIRPLVTKMAFSCQRCLEVQVISLPDGSTHDVFSIVADAWQGKYVMPTQCSSEGCRGKVFEPERTSPHTEVTMALKPTPSSTHLDHRQPDSQAARDHERRPA